MSEEEKKIINESPDFEHQQEIIDEEKRLNNQKRKWYLIMVVVLLLDVLILAVSFSFHLYKPYSHDNGIVNACDNVNIKMYDSKVPLINIAKNNKCIPNFNIDYFNNRRPTFNIDIFGDGSKIFNPVNQLDDTHTYCIINCDSNNDGWPDYNIDIDGDGDLDLNIVNDPKSNKKVCVKNCDLNHDTIPDTNIEIDGETINIANKTVPNNNIDYKNNHKKIFNVIINDYINNPMNVMENGKCVKNCDIDNDGWPDYNIDLGNNIILNELINIGNGKVIYNKGKNVDWKCVLNPNDPTCKNNKKTGRNTYINIDYNGDGIPDINKSNDGGKTITNPINKEVNGKTLNYDIDQDGFPEYNIDINDDGIPDINIYDEKTKQCIKNCDLNFDGIPDYNIEIDNNLINIRNLNIDIDFDGKCDVNCDLNGDLYPDINIDTNGDTLPDINIDYNGDGKADYNIDTNNDNKPDTNLSAHNDGICTFNCNNKNIVSNSNTCTKNCDTDNDGWPDKNVDINNDGKCDYNCNGDNNDSDHNYYLDDDYKDDFSDIVIDKADSSNMYIYNPISIRAENIAPGWNKTYVLIIKNTTNYAISYNMVWNQVENEFSEKLSYHIDRNSSRFLNELRMPKVNQAVKENELLKARCSVRYVVTVTFQEAGYNQLEDSGKTFNGKLLINVVH